MMLRQKRPTEIKVIGIVALIIGILNFLVGLVLVTSFVSLSDLGVDVSGLEPETLDIIALGAGIFHLVMAAYCVFTYLSTLWRFKWAWISNMALSMIIYGMGFFAFQGGNYIDGTIDAVLSTVITSLMYTEPVKQYLKKVD